MKKSISFISLTLSLILFQTALADSAPRVICGNADPRFSYASNNLNVQLKWAIDRHMDEYSFFSASQIIPLLTQNTINSQTVINRSFIGCAAINFLSEEEIISDNSFKNEVTQEVCGDAFATPEAAVNLLNSAIQNHAFLATQNHKVITSFSISTVTASQQDFIERRLTGQNYKACATVLSS